MQQQKPRHVSEVRSLLGDCDYVQIIRFSIVSCKWSTCIYFADAFFPPKIKARNKRKDVQLWDFRLSAQRCFTANLAIWTRNPLVPTLLLLARFFSQCIAVAFPTDNGPAGDRKTGTATVHVEVLDVNDNRPIFLQNSYETTILESVPRGTSVLQVPITSPFQHEGKRRYSEKK